MKNTGIVRGIDNLGRIVLPKELRTTLNIDKDTQLEIFVEGEAIVLRKYRPEGRCELCGTASQDRIQFNGHSICGSCRRRLAEL